MANKLAEKRLNYGQTKRLLTLKRVFMGVFLYHFIFTDYRLPK